MSVRPSVFRHAFFALLLAIAQLLLVAHAVDHAADGEEGLQASAHCERCLLGQNLGHALPTIPLLPVIPVLGEVCPSVALPVSCPAAVPTARQGAPPAVLH